MLSQVWAGIIDLIWPPVCLGCKRRLPEDSVDGVVCHSCWSKIKKNSPPFCNSCGRKLPAQSLKRGICPACVRKQLHFDRAFSPCVYDGTLKELLHAFKYQNKDYLGPTLGRLMVDFIRQYQLPMDVIDMIVPVPLHQTKLREREFNQSQLLGECVAKEFNKTLNHTVLRRHRYTKAQASLAQEQRLANVRDSFSLAAQEAESIRGKNILLIDDVVTTGATSSEAARILKQEGAQIVFVLSLAN